MTKNTLSEYKKQTHGLCPHCNPPKTVYYWCQNCNSKRFQQDFDKWTSGNKFIDKFIQDTQLKANNLWEVLEWIPYDRLRNVQYLTRGGFSTIYKAIWLDGRIEEWNSKKQKWKRGKRNVNAIKDEKYEEDGWQVVLKSLNYSSNINEDSLNEVRNLLSSVRQPFIT